MSLEKIITDAWEIRDQIDQESNPKLKDAIKMAHLNDLIVNLDNGSPK